jgi:Aromatic-ring-opening dioxygenase LigAB, LigA subunit
MSKTADLIAKLSSDPDLLARYKSDPEAVMDEAGLSEEDKTVMRTNDPQKITEHLGDDAPPGCFQMFD